MPRQQSVSCEVQKLFILRHTFFLGLQVYKLLDELLLMLPVTAASTAIVFSACRLQGSFLLFWLVNLVTLANGTGRHAQML